MQTATRSTSGASSERSPRRCVVRSTRAIEAVRFPGVAERYVDGHHLEHWIDGGETTRDNMTLL